MAEFLDPLEQGTDRVQVPVTVTLTREMVRLLAREAHFGLTDDEKQMVSHAWHLLRWACRLKLEEN